MRQVTYGIVISLGKTPGNPCKGSDHGIVISLGKIPGNPCKGNNIRNDL